MEYRQLNDYFELTYDYPGAFFGRYLDINNATSTSGELPSMFTNTNGFSSIYLKNITNNTITIKKVLITFDPPHLSQPKIFAEIDSHVETRPTTNVYSLKIQANERKQLLFDNFTSRYVSHSNSVSFSEAGLFGIYVVVYDENDNVYTQGHWSDDWDAIGYVTVLPLIYKNYQVTTTNVQREFKQGEPFNYSGLVFTADRYYQVNDTKYDSIVITNYNITPVDTNSVGLFNVNVRTQDNAFTTTYSVRVYGVSSVEIDTPTKTTFERGETLSGQPTEMTISFEDEDEVVLTNLSYEYDFSVVGQQSVKVIGHYDLTNRDYEKSYSVTVGDLEVSDVSLTGTTDLTLTEGNNFSLNSVGIVLTLANGATIEGNISGSTISWSDNTQSQIDSTNLPFDIGEEIVVNSKTTNAYFSFIFRNLSYDTDPFDINYKYISGIEIIDTTVNKAYFTEEAFSSSGLIVKTIEKDTGDSEYEEKETTTAYELVRADNGEVIYNDYVFENSDVSSNLRIYVNYTGKAGLNRPSFVISVKQPEIESLVVAEGEIEDTYNEGDTFDIGDVVINAVYDNDETEDVTDLCYFTIGGKNINVGEKITNEYVNGSTIQAHYSNKTLDLGTIDLTYRVITSIALRTGSFDFTIGTPINLNGVSVTGTYNIGLPETEIINSNRLTFKYRNTDEEDYNDLENGHVFGVDDDIDKVKIIFNDIELVVNASVDMPEMVGISVSASDENRQLVVNGTNTWNASQVLTVKPIYANGLITDETITDWTLKYQLSFIESGTNKIVLPTGEDYGDRNVTVQYNSFEATIVVSLTPNKAVESLYVSLVNDVVYKVGDKLKKSDFIVMARFEDEVKETQIYDYTITPAENTTFYSSGYKKISVSYNGKIAETTINIRMVDDGGIRELKQLKMAFGDGNFYSNKKEIIKNTEVTFGVSFDIEGNASGNLPIFEQDKVSVDDNAQHGTYGYNIYNGDNFAEDVKGYIALGSNTENARVVLFDEYINPVMGDGNAIITFPHYAKGLADKINKSTFGLVFNKSLFVSGNPNNKNVDYHTEPVNISQIDNADYNLGQGDYSYFSDLNYCVYGGEDTAIVGYTISRDGDLLVVKEGSRNQATLYRREAEQTTAVDYAGNVINGQVETQYPMFDVNINGGEGGLSNRSITNFVGDSLVLTRTGIKAITTKENIYSNAKYSIDVSTYINPIITNEDLTNAYMFAYKENIIISNTNWTYIGYYENRNENNEYEWYRLVGFAPRLFFEYEGNLYYGTNDGKIASFGEAYKDSTRAFTGDNGAFLDLTNNRITLSSEYDIENGYWFNLISHITDNQVDETKEIHGSLGYFLDYNTKINDPTQYTEDYVGTFENGVLTLDINRADTSEYYNGRKVFIDELGVGAGLVNKELTLKRVVTESSTNIKYELTDENGYKVNIPPTITNLRLSYRISSLEHAFVSDLQGRSFKLVNGKGKEIKLIKYNNINDPSYSAVITSKKNVEAYYITKPYDMGTIAYTKNIWSWDIVNDTNLASEMDIEYFCNRADKFRKSIQSVNGARTILSQQEIAFDRLHFTSDTLPEIYSKHRALTNIGYVRFKFENFEATNIVLTKLSILYTIENEMKGVK